MFTHTLGVALACVDWPKLTGHWNCVGLGSRTMGLTLKHTRVTLKLRGLLTLKCARLQVKCTHGSFFFSSLYDEHNLA